MTEKINLNVKHPLQNTWIMWYDHNDKRNNSAQAWSDNLKQVNAIDTVEDFWG
jgi:translation initiation factor 4E